MNSFNPKISIIIPVYNGANFLKKAIDSALNQTYENIEVLVVNDGSNDHGATEEIAHSYGNKIKYYAKENGGVASTLNFAVDKMTGEYFSWLSHDDMYYPDKVKKQVAALVQADDPNAIVVCNVTVIDHNDQKIKSNQISSRASRSIRCFLATDTDTGLNGCSLLVPKALFSKVGQFDTSLKAAQDYDLWFKFSYYAQFLILEDALVMSRMHELQGSRTMGSLPTLEADNLHSMMLSKIEVTEMRRFIGNETNYLLNAYTTYHNAGYHKTSARIYAMMIKLAFELGEIEQASLLLANRLFAPEKNSLKRARQIIHTILRNFPDNQKPTILIYCNVWFKGGIERVMYVLFEELRHKYNFILISHLTVENFEGFEFSPEICHIEIRSDLLSEIPYVLLLLASLSQASLLISNPNIIMDVLKIYPVMKASGIKTIACNHYYYFLPTWASWLYPIMAERISYLKEATVATWLNSFNANAYALNNNNAAIMHNPNTFDLLESDSSDKSGNIVLCVGRFYDSIKRLDRALNVFKHVLAKKPDAKLVLVGGYNLDLKIPVSSPETVRELLDRLDFPEGSVIFKGEQDAVTDYYQKASVLIMPSDYEGFSLALTEAGTFGIPSVIFGIPGLEDLITDGKNGFVVKQDDLEGMAEKIVTLLSQEELRLSMGQNARNMVKRFDRKIICSRWSNLIDMVLSTENTQVLETQLSECFMTPPTNMGSFAKIISQEYEKGIRTVISERAQRPIAAAYQPVEAVKRPMDTAYLPVEVAAHPLEGAYQSLQADYQALQIEHQALQTAHKTLLATHQSLYEDHKQLLFYFHDVLNSKAVRYSIKIKDMIRKLRRVISPSAK